MGKNDLEAPAGNPMWPLATRAGGGELAVPGAYYAQGNGDGAETELNLATLWRIVWEWRWLILAMTAAGLGLAVIVTLLTTPLYKSTAVLEISPPSVEVMENSNAGGGPPSLNDPTFLATQHGLLASRTLAERVSQDLNLVANEALAPQDLDRGARQEIVTNNLMKNLSVDPLPDSRLIRISFESPDPSISARIVNGFADSFISTGLERRYEASSYARDFLQRQIANVRRDLETSERQLVGYAQRQGIIITGSGQGPANDSNSLTGESLVALNRALAESQARRIAAEQRYREALSAGPTAEANERTQALRTQRATLQAEYQEKLNLFQPDYPEMVQLRARIASVDEAIRSESSDVRAGRAGTLRAEFQAAASEETQLRQRVEGLRQEVLNLRGRSIQYTILQRDVDTNRALYDALLQRYKEIGVAGGIGTSLASVVDRGVVPSVPSKPNLIFNLIAGLFLGLAAGLGAALALEFIKDTIKSPDDVRDRLRLAFLGGIPASKGRKPIEDLRDPTSPISEAYFSSATSLRFATEHGEPKTLLLTSTRPAEGKSTTTWALAQHFARLGRSVLLIDADLRKPAFVTGHEKEDGLSTLLTTRSALRAHVSQTDMAGLWLLPCGPLPPNPAELLSSPRLKAVLDEAAAEFDIVIVDGPPILGLADSPLLSTVCEATIMIIEAGKTRTRAAMEALNRMRAAGSNVVGVILTRYRHEATGYGYNYDAYTYRSVEQSERQIHAIASDAA